MSCEQLSELLPDYWAGRLTDADRQALEAHLADCPACRAEAESLTSTWQALGALAADEPSAALRGRFDAMLDDWREQEADARQATAQAQTALAPTTLAQATRRGAAEPVSLSARRREIEIEREIELARSDRRRDDDRGGRDARGPVGTWERDDDRSDDRSMDRGTRRDVRTAAATPTPTRGTSSWRPAMQMAAALLVAVAGFGAGRLWSGSSQHTELARSEVTELRQELRDMRQMMTLTLLQQQSATERLRGVSWSSQVDRPGSPVLDALLDTLARDPNVNVRLASIEALTQFGQDARIRRGMVDELATNRQDSPLVQIALIDALVGMKERESVGAMRTLAADQKVNEAVRQRATWGADTLSKS